MRLFDTSRALMDFKTEPCGIYCIRRREYQIITSGFIPGVAMVFDPWPVCPAEVAGQDIFKSKEG